MWKITSKFLLLICLLIIPLSCAEDMKKDSSKNENESVLQGRHRRLFARRRGSTAHYSIPKHKVEEWAPVRRCGRLMENCSAHLPCCDPCASCRCRLFNTICHCWRVAGPQCPHKA